MLQPPGLRRFHPFMIKDGPMRSRALSTSAGQFRPFHFMQPSSACDVCSKKPLCSMHNGAEATALGQQRPHIWD